MSGFIGWWIQHRKKNKNEDENMRAYVSSMKYKDTFLDAVKEKGIKSKEAQDAYIDIRMNGGWVSLDWPHGWVMVQENDPPIN